MDTRNIFEIRLDALQRLAMSTLLAGRLPLYIVNEYPKSGGSWVGQMLADLLSIPFPRNRRPELRSCVMHAHYPYMLGLRNVLVVFRDGRDAMVSAYYHFLVPSEKNSPKLVARTREALGFDDYDDIRTNLPTFIEYMFNGFVSRLNPFRFSWADFVDEWVDRDVVSLRYEDLLRDTTGTMGRVVEELTGRRPFEDRLSAVADKYSFARQTSRAPGQEDIGNFLRKGIAGDWKEKFSPSARRVFAEFAGAQLIRLGYEGDLSWVDGTP